MAFNITTNYAGDALLEYIAKAFYDGRTIGENLVTLVPNIKDKRNITKMASSGILQADGCSFNASGDVDLTEVVLDPTAIKVNVELCKTDLEGTWQADRMRSGALNTDLGDLQSFIGDYMASLVSEDIELIIWQGDTASGATSTLQLFDGFEKLFDIAGADVAGTTLSASNILTEIGKVYDAIPEQLLNSPDLKIYVSHAAARFYKRALATSSGDANFAVYGDKPLDYLGIPIEPVRLSNNKMVAAESTNLFVGTDLVSDFNEMKVIDMSETDGSDNVRLKMRFKAGVQVAYRDEVVYYA